MSRHEQRQKVSKTHHEDVAVVLRTSQTEPNTPLKFLLYDDWLRLRKNNGSVKINNLVIDKVNAVTFSKSQAYWELPRAIFVNFHEVIHQPKTEGIISTAKNGIVEAMQGVREVAVRGLTR